MASDSRRGSLVAILLVLLVFGAGVVASARMLAGGRVLPAGDRVAVISLSGPIENEHRFIEELHGFSRERGIRAFVIEIESPGGTVGATQSIYEAIRDLRDRDDRPIVAWMGDIAASGGFYVAMAADTVLALPGTITGSIGVIMEFPNAEELYRKVGLDWEVVKSGEYKDMGSSSRSLGEGDRRILQDLVTDVHEQFVDAVAANRSLGREAIAVLADGRIYSGRQAAELGLVDGLATLDEAVSMAGRLAGLGPDPRIERPAVPRIGLWDVIRGVSASEARGLLRTWVPTHSGTPRLLYEWR